MQIASVDGLTNDILLSRAEAVMEAARLVLPRAGFDISTLLDIEKRISNRRCPANEILDWMNAGIALQEVLAGIAVTPHLLPDVAAASPSATTQSA